MTDSMLIRDLAFYRRDDVPAEISWWASAESDHPISIVIEPAGPVDDATRARVESILQAFPATLTAARSWLAAALAAEGSQLSDDERALVSADSFEDPEVMVWSADEWMIRFDAPTLAMADEWGVGVRFEGDEPVAVEDLSDMDDDEDDHDHN